MAPEELAKALGIGGKKLRAWLRECFPRPTNEKGGAWSMTPAQIKAAEEHFSRQPSGFARLVLTQTDLPRLRARRTHSDEAYVIDLCDELLNAKGLRQHRFDWLVGDPGSDGACRCLPVDAYYPQHALVVEYRERQHVEAVPFFDRRHTVSGVGRGEQRRIYDLRRDEEIPKHGLRLLTIRPGQLDADRRGQLRRNKEHDRRALKLILPLQKVEEN